jgi:hypothetical protein
VTLYIIDSDIYSIYRTKQKHKQNTNPNHTVNKQTQSTMATIVDNRNRTNNDCNWSTKCCGCCCEMREAVIAVNMISIGMAVMAIGLEIVGIKLINSPSFDIEAFDDDTTKGAINNIQDYASILVPIIIAANVVFIIVNSLGVYGANKNKIWPVAVSLGGHILYLGISIFMINFIGIIVASSFAYPHIFFIRELKQKRNSTSSNGNGHGNVNFTDNVEMAEIDDDDVTVKEDFDDMSELDVNHNYDNTKEIAVNGTIV